MKLILLGATGLVGSHVLELALADARISEIIAQSPNAPAFSHRWWISITFPKMPLGGAPTP